MKTVLFSLCRAHRQTSVPSLCFGLLAACAAGIMLLAAAPARADEFPDRFGLRLGGYAIQNASTIVRLDSINAPIGTYVDFQNTLGGDTSSTVFRLDGFFRFNENHALLFSGYDVKFTGSRVLDRDIIWDGQTYPISASVDSKLEFNIYKLSYQYSAYHNDAVELGASFGLFVMRSSVSISAGRLGLADSQSVTAPLPVFGLFADYKFTPRLSAYYNYQFFFINYEDKIRGGLQDFLFGLEYRLLRHVSLGAAYNRFNVNMKANRDDSSTLYLNTSWNGGMLYAAVYF